MGYGAGVSGLCHTNRNNLSRTLHSSPLPSPQSAHQNAFLSSVRERRRRRFGVPLFDLYAAEKNVTVLSKNIQLFSYLSSDVEHASTLW